MAQKVNYFQLNVRTGVGISSTLVQINTVMCLQSQNFGGQNTVSMEHACTHIHTHINSRTLYMCTHAKKSQK